MNIDVREIKRSHGLSRDLRCEGGFEPEGLELASPLVVDLKITNAGSRVLVVGTLRASARQVCARCACDYVEELEVPVDEHFVPHDSPEAPQGEDIEPELLNVFTYENEEIELDEVIRQNLVAALPSRPLCREECRGLCSQCGANLNEMACECEAEASFDPRWGPLRDLQDRKQTG